MKVIRIRKPSNEFNELIGPRLSFMGVPKKEQCLQIVLTLLEEYPENVLVLAAIEENVGEDAKPEVLGFLVAQAVLDQESILLLQLYADGNDLNSRLMGFLRKWAESGKRRFIRVVTQNPEMFKTLEFRDEAFQMILKLEKEDEILFEDENEASKNTQQKSVGSSESVPANEGPVGGSPEPSK
jgi:hypothetical protein